MNLNLSWIRLGKTVLVIVALAVGVAAADPGLDLPNDPALRLDSQVSDQKKGSVLVYNIYTSSPSSPGSQNTRFSITNTNDQRGIAVHLFFVDGSSCSISDRYVCLTANQTMTFLASEQDPGTTGYLIAIATDSFEGRPSAFDYLIGEESVKFQTGFFGNLGAEAISVSILPLLSFPLDGGSKARLEFDGICYNKLPRVLAVDSIGSRGDANETLIVINRFGGDLTISGAFIGTLFGILYNDQEESHSWNTAAGCQGIAVLSNSFPKTAPRFDVVIPTGQTGWMKFWSTSADDAFSTGGRALLGSVFQLNANTNAAAGGFQGGRNLHKLRLATFASLIIPIFPPTCAFSDNI